MKKTGTICFALCCFLLCAVLSVGTAVFGPAGAGANERLNPLPKLMVKGELNRDWLSGFAAWFGDHFWLRQECISLRNRLVTLTGFSPVEDVLAGRDGWLYYAPTLPDYTGADPMTDGELEACAHNLSLMGEYCRDRGIGFLFVPVPNKNTLYPEHMRGYPAGGTHDGEKLLNLPALGQTPHADLFSAFREQEETLYYAHDSHWTPKGAALAADTVNAALGRESAYYSGDFSARARHDGDLYGMLYPAAEDPEQGPVYGGTFRYEREGTDTRPDSITINTRGEGSGALLAYRDSFGNDLYPYLADSFASARFSRSTAYDLTLAESLEADVLLIELVERNLRYLLTYTPKMPAPLREQAVPEVTLPAADLRVGRPGELAGYRLVSGSLETGADRVYLVCAGGCYEAFLTEGGFAAWLPEGETPERVLTLRGEALAAAPVNLIP